MDYDEVRDELLAAVDRAKDLSLVHGITTVQPVHDDPACPCTIEYRNPEDVHMIILFACPRHGDGAQRIRTHLQGQPQ